MEYVILTNNPIINGETLSNFINIIDVTNNIANVNISNNESITHTITITNNDIGNSIESYFSQYY